VPGRKIARTFPFPHAVYPSSATTPGNGLLAQGSRTGPSDQQSTLWGLLSRPTPLWINPRASAVQRSWLANLSASLRSEPGGIRRASSKTSAARLSQSSLSSRRCVSLLIAPQSSRCLDLSKPFDSKTLISAMLFPP